MPRTPASNGHFLRSATKVYPPRRPLTHVAAPSLHAGPSQSRRGAQAGPSAPQSSTTSADARPSAGAAAQAPAPQADRYDGSPRGAGALSGQGAPQLSPPAAAPRQPALQAATSPRMAGTARRGTPPVAVASSACPTPLADRFGLCADDLDQPKHAAVKALLANAPAQLQASMFLAFDEQLQALPLAQHRLRYLHCFAGLSTEEAIEAAQAICAWLPDVKNRGGDPIALLNLAAGVLIPLDASVRLSVAHAARLAQLERLKPVEARVVAQTFAELPAASRQEIAMLSGKLCQHAATAQDFIFVIKALEAIDAGTRIRVADAVERMMERNTPGERIADMLLRTAKQPMGTLVRLVSQMREVRRLLTPLEDELSARQGRPSGSSPASSSEGQAIEERGRRMYAVWLILCSFKPDDQTKFMTMFAGLMKKFDDFVVLFSALRSFITQPSEQWEEILNRFEAINVLVGNGMDVADFGEYFDNHVRSLDAEPYQRLKQGLSQLAVQNYPPSDRMVILRALARLPAAQMPEFIFAVRSLLLAGPQVAAKLGAIVDGLSRKPAHAWMNIVDQIDELRETLAAEQLLQKTLELVGAQA